MGCKKIKWRTENGVANYTQVFSWVDADQSEQRWFPRESPPYHRFSTDHFLSLQTQSLGVCVHMPFSRSLNFRLQVFSNPRHLGTCGQTGNLHVWSHQNQNWGSSLA